jgi:O-antigen/teichoic acid export membrane protein
MWFFYVPDCDKIVQSLNTYKTFEENWEDLMSQKLKLIVGFALSVFLVACVMAYLAVGLSGFDNVLAEPWGLVTILDLVLGVVCMTAVIFTVESDWKKAAMWSVPIYFLGNIVTAVWILTRLDQITDSK